MRTETERQATGSEHVANRERLVNEHGAHEVRTGTEQRPNTHRKDDAREMHVNLAPTDPPGRITRKARQFSAQIGQLRAQGYTLDAIRRALASVGVQVSISTVRREATRRDLPTVPASVGVPICEVRNAFEPRRPGVAAASATEAASPDEASAKEQAEAFLRSQITNPFLRAKEPT